MVPRKPAIISQQNLSLGAVQKIDVLTSATGSQRHHAKVLAEISGHAQWTVKAFDAFFFVGSIR